MDGYNVEKKSIEGMAISFPDNKRGFVSGKEKFVFRDVSGFDINLELHKIMQRKNVGFYCVVDEIRNGSSPGCKGADGERVTLSVIYGNYVD
jgi:hypothetical protein